ncbi:MAG TPA: methylated-DNA--[protein]-cysteine S-methyltransferase [Solirubrobacterales bacterium]|jgi:methylated-DNA-[protein]-cysteine S-methyltransferase|nr:methylated-DNA--[protein]-cysteine S-methyltransferase [Solirubrobacterales bacterium]
MNRIDERELKRILGETPAADSEAAARELAERADREGLAEVAYATLDTPLGTALVAGTERGLVRVMLPNDSVDRVLEQISRRISPRVLELPARLDRERRELDEYFEGRRHDFDLALDWRLTPTGFYRKVLRAAARRLPFGVTASYGEIAHWAGNPRAYRAAGTALASNPIPIVVPCHRVLRAGGELGEYGGGPKMKEWLLRLEGAIGD